VQAREGDTNKSRGGCARQGRGLHNREGGANKSREGGGGACTVDKEGTHGCEGRVHTVVKGGRIRLIGGAHGYGGGRARVRRGSARLLGGTHGWGRRRAWVGKGGAHGLWEGHARVGMGARTTVAFTNFRV
jgi:hypothetical protein